MPVAPTAAGRDRARCRATVRTGPAHLDDVGAHEPAPAAHRRDLDHHLLPGQGVAHEDHPPGVVVHGPGHAVAAVGGCPHREGEDLALSL